MKYKKLTVFLVAFFLLISFSQILYADQYYNQEKTLDETLMILKNTNWVESYSFQQWDCTNMSSTLSIILSKQGIRNWIICGDGDDDPLIWHAMLQAEIDGQKVWIEPTCLTWFKSEKPYENWKTFGVFDGLAGTGNMYVSYGNTEEWIYIRWDWIKLVEEELKKPYLFKYLEGKIVFDDLGFQNQAALTTISAVWFWGSRS